MKLVEDLGLDGLDVDWEYPANKAQGQDFAALLAETRVSLDGLVGKIQRQTGDHRRPKFDLTVACPAGPDKIANLCVAEMDASVSFWNLMAYDYAGSWDARAGHQANLYASPMHPACTPFSTAAAVDAYVQAGVRPDKIVLGMPLYGRAFQGTSGPGHTFAGTGEGSWEQGVWDYKALPLAGHGEQHDCYGEDACGASWSYSRDGRCMVSYDTVEMARVKAAFVRERGLGGGMWWESSGDKEVGGGSLVEAFVEGVGGRECLDDGKNWLEFPGSKYENLRRGFSGEGEEACK